MKFLHTADLHIGKIINDFSMLEDQRHILKQILEIARSKKADALVLAGDIYDRAIPPAEAVVVLGDFLQEAVDAGIAVLMISGNHDSPERVGFAGGILEKQGIFIAGLYHDELKQVRFKDAYGDVTFVLMPFVKPALVGARTSGEAVAKMLEIFSEENKSREAERRILITHYFVTDNGREPELSDGETTIHVGGLDNVEVSLFAGFDYVALGHIHKPQQIGEGHVYYAGASLAYSFFEAGQTKYVNLVEVKEKGEVSVERVALTPLHELRKIRGKIGDLMKPEIVAAADCMDYLQAELTDEAELIDPIGTMRSVYPNIMQIILSKNEKRAEEEYVTCLEERKKSIPELFQRFYTMIRGEGPDEQRMELIEEVAKEAGENSYET